MFLKRRQSQLKGRFHALTATAFVALFIAVAGLLWIAEAQALRISMKRIIFEGSKRSDIITIMNNTATEQVYRLGWRHYRMDERKSLINIDDDAAATAAIKWADDMVNFAPRRVTIPPGGSQQIRLLLRRPRDLAPGEYRSHLWIVTETPVEDFAETGDSAGQSFKLTMQPALTLPIFVRHGELTAAAKITDASLERTEDGLAVNFILHREGNRSLYGDLKVTCNAGGDEYIAHQVRGIAVYTEVSKRVFNYDLNVPPENMGACSRVLIEYIADNSDAQYSGQVMAKATASAGG